MNCPNCSQDGITDKYWLYAWPFYATCSYCKSKVRASLEIKSSIFIQALVIILLLSLWYPLRELNTYISIGIPAVIALITGMMLVKKYSYLRIIK